MKYLIAFLLIAFNANLFSQDKIDPPNVIAGYPFYQNVISRDVNYFIRGWNWGSPGKEFDSAMHINTSHSYNPVSSDYNDGLKIISNF